MSDLTPPDSQKDKYSVQEMMDRLRTAPAAVSPTTGKRKRRSSQPVVLGRKKRRRWFVIIILSALLIGFGIMIFLMLNRTRIEGEIFRSTANRRFSEALGCEVECDRFRSKGLHELECANIHFTGKAGVFKDALITNLRSTLTTSSTFRNEWDLPSLLIDAVDLGFQSQATAPRLDDESIESLEPRKPDDSFRLGLSAEPSFVTVSDFRIEKAGFTWPNSKGGMNRIEDLRASGSLIGGLLKVEALNGRWIGGIWPESVVQNLNLNITPRGVEVVSARIEIAPNAQLRAAGKISFTPDGPSGKLDVKSPNLQLSQLLHPVWQNRLSGKFEPGPMTYTILPGKPDEFSGEFSMTGAVVMGFPGFNALTAFFKTELYSKLEFPMLKASFRRTDDALIIENIDAFRQGECRLNGSVTVHKDGRLEGKLRLALNTSAVGLPQFSGEDNGLDIIDFTLGGTETDPQDSLTTLFPAP